MANSRSGPTCFVVITGLPEERKKHLTLDMSELSDESHLSVIVNKFFQLLRLGALKVCEVFSNEFMLDLS